MKKFYYKKEDAVEKTPIVLERRNTISKEVKEEVENRLSTRTSSLGSFDQLRDASLIPRINSREITKCLSEDVLSRSCMNNPGKVITERELSSSRLYATRKASLNTNDSPIQHIAQKDDLSPVKLTDPKYKPIPVQPNARHKRNSSSYYPQQLTHKNDLSPVALKDPKFKPVPVPPKNRRKKDSSCLCYLVVFLAISLCTIGVLGAVTGLLYSEIFTDKNSTSQRLQGTVINFTNLSQNDSSMHEYHVLTDEIFGRIISIESADYDSTEIRRSGSNLMVSENVSTLQSGQMDMTDLSRLLDSKEAEIKFQDSETTIFEVNTSSSVEQENNTDNLGVIEEIKSNDPEINPISEIGGTDILNTEHVLDDSTIIKIEKLEINPSVFDARQRENGGAVTFIEQEIHDPTTDVKHIDVLYSNDNIKEMEFPESEKEIDASRTLNNMKQDIDNFQIMNKNLEKDSSKIIIREDFEVFDKKTEVEEENIKFSDTLLNPQTNALKDSSNVGRNSDPSDGINHSTTSNFATESENQSITFSENTDNVILPNEHISVPSVKLIDAKFENQTITVSLPKDKVVWKAGDTAKVSNVDNESELVGKEISNENLVDNAIDKTEHDVAAILEVINEPADNEQDQFTVNRNGDIDVASETSNLGLKHNLNLFNEKREGGDSPVQLRTESQSSQEDQKSKETLRVKPLNMKVSLAEAMKHLQSLDVNNKVLTSRMKSPKPLSQREKSSKVNNKQRKKENITADRMQYLHNLRLALQGNLIGL